jgi:hypothetical protein
MFGSSEMADDREQRRKDAIKKGKIKQRAENNRKRVIKLNAKVAANNKAEGRKDSDGRRHFPKRKYK